MVRAFAHGAMGRRIDPSRVCVCVCVYAYMCMYMYIYRVFYNIGPYKKLLFILLLTL